MITPQQIREHNKTFIDTLMKDGVGVDGLADAVLSLATFIICLSKDEDKKLEMYEEFVRQLAEKVHKSPLVKDTKA